MFELPLPAGARARRVTLDPDFHLLRRLAPSELPPAIRRVLGADRRRLVLPDAGDPLAEAARALAEGLAPRLGAEVIAANEAGAPRAGDVVIGDPDRSAPAATLASRLPAGLALTNLGVQTPGGPVIGPSVLLLACAPTADEGVALLVRPGSPAALAAASKLIHYGQYAWVAFDAGRAVARGRPEPRAGGPLSVELPRR